MKKLIVITCIMVTFSCGNKHENHHGFPAEKYSSVKLFSLQPDLYNSYDFDSLKKTGILREINNGLSFFDSTGKPFSQYVIEKPLDSLSVNAVKAIFDTSNIALTSFIVDDGISNNVMGFIRMRLFFTANLTSLLHL